MIITLSVLPGSVPGGGQLSASRWSSLRICPAWHTGQLTAESVPSASTQANHSRDRVK